MPLKLTSPAFRSGDLMPHELSAEANNMSPQLEWSWVPEGTREFALVCEDPDAPTERPWVHWLIYNIPGTVSMLPAGIPPRVSVDIPPGASQGVNSFGHVGYGGPLPPPGDDAHRYVFRLFALDQAIYLPERADREALWKAIRLHILDQAELVGKYRREALRSTA